MKMSDPLRKAGHLFLALLLITMALPAKGEDTSQSASPAPTSEEASKPAAGQTAATTAPEQAQPKAAPEPAAKKAAPAPSAANITPPPESTTPPRGLKLVGNHWTPYEPPDPESFPEGAQVHVIVNGDTLW